MAATEADVSKNMFYRGEVLLLLQASPGFEVFRTQLSINSGIIFKKVDVWKICGLASVVIFMFFYEFQYSG